MNFDDKGRVVSALPLGYLHSIDICLSGKKSEVRTPSNLGLILEHITNLAEVRILSMCHSLPLFD
jgi:hypothetical protein